MEMVDEDTVAPRLADEDLEERFAELQHVLHIKDEAIAKAEELSNAKPGDEAYDDIMADVTGSDVDEKVQAVLDQLVRALPSPMSRLLLLVV
jgi:flagellar motor switch protein FliG